ncbi:MAG: DsbA family protein [Terriglobales bacterium]
MGLPHSRPPARWTAIAACLFLFPAGAFSLPQAAPALPAPVVAPELGNPHAKVRVVVFEDLECPDCAHWRQLMNDGIFAQYRRTVRFEFRDYPLSQHPWAYNAALLARFFATKSPRLYFAWQNFCFTHQDQITATNLLGDAIALGQAAGIPSAEVESAFSDPALFAAIRRDQQQGKRWGIVHTPTILVGRNRPGMDRDGSLDLHGLAEASTPAQLRQMIADLEP